MNSAPHLAATVQRNVAMQALTIIEQQLYACEIGKHYPAPIVDVEATRKKASEIVWSFRKNEDVKIEGKKILAKHVNLSRSKLSKTKK
jgi:deoxyribodipyrimidine photo-lyase